MYNKPLDTETESLRSVETTHRSRSVKSLAVTR